jgi:hypothetical protein
MNGTITSYDNQTGRGRVTLDDGRDVPIRWTAITISPSEAERRRCGHIPDHVRSTDVRVGDVVRYDRNASNRPFEIVGGA